MPSASHLYLFWMLSDRFSLGPQINFRSNWLGSNHSWHARLGLTGAYYFRSWRDKSLYVESELNGVWLNGDREGNIFGFGVGYQIPRGEKLVWRVKIDWNRWMFDVLDDLTDGFSVSLSLARR